MVDRNPDKILAVRQQALNVTLLYRKRPSGSGNRSDNGSGSSEN